MAIGFFLKKVFSFCRLEWWGRRHRKRIFKYSTQVSVCVWNKRLRDLLWKRFPTWISLVFSISFLLEDSHLSENFRPRGPYEWHSRPYSEREVTGINWGLVDSHMMRVPSRLRLLWRGQMTIGPRWSSLSLCNCVPVCSCRLPSFSLKLRIDQNTGTTVRLYSYMRVKNVGRRRHTYHNRRT